MLGTLLAGSSSMGLCQQKSQKVESTLSAGGAISTMLCLLLTEAATLTTAAPETALHIHKDTDLREQLPSAQNLLIWSVQFLSVVLRDICFSHVWFMRFSSYTLLWKALKHVWKNLIFYTTLIGLQCLRSAECDFSWKNLLNHWINFNTIFCLLLSCHVKFISSFFLWMKYNWLSLACMLKKTWTTWLTCLNPILKV